jgi:hypothetical protein
MTEFTGIFWLSSHTNIAVHAPSFRASRFARCARFVVTLCASTAVTPSLVKVLFKQSRSYR